MKHLDLIMFIVIFALIPFWIYMAYKIDGCNQPSVEVLFELCGNGAPLVKDGEMYMVVCIPMDKR
jgi:hypothetical protein